MAKRKSTEHQISMRACIAPPQFQPTDRDAFLDPFDDRTLIAYYDDVLKWHGYIKFLGMPHLRDNLDVGIQKLYIEPSGSKDYINPDAPVGEWPDRRPIQQMIVEHPRLVLLGDPGSGKSTLVSWLAWQFSRAEQSILTVNLGRLVPFPLVLRELSIGPDITWDRLLDSFLSKPVARALKSREHVEDILQRGQALIMLDGLDEIGSARTREALHKAVLDGLSRYPACRWLLTSRIVGYESVPFDRLSLECKSGDDRDLMADMPAKSDATVPAWAEIGFVTPFDDPQIEKFARNWFAVREQSEAERERKTKDFVRAIYQVDETHNLARIPNILTFMALIHRVRAQLPHGRAMLYNQIAEAYLQSIDEFRGLKDIEYPLSRKKRWLAYVAYQMQLRRSGDEERNEGLLVNARDLLKWMAVAMGGESNKGAKAEAREFIDYVGRRSGLFIPRGEGVYAFVHLSFQEYFAAFHLMRQLTSPAIGKEKDPFEELREYALSPIWHETMVFLFELLADDNEEWVNELYVALFADLGGAKDVEAAVLLARLSVDPHSGFTDAQRHDAWEACWRSELARLDPSSRWETARIPRSLFAASPAYIQHVWEALGGANPEQLSLDGCTGITDISHLAQLSSLQLLHLTCCTGITDISHLAQLSSLQELYLACCTGITDISHLAQLSNLQRLGLDGCTGITDISHLAGLSSLQSLGLDGCTGITNISHLAQLCSLRLLHLNGCTGITDISHLAQLSNLLRLDLEGCTGITDISHLAGLSNLQWLDLEGCTGITDISHLAQLSSLKWLYLNGCTGITDISHLAGLSSLQSLYLDGCTGIKEVPEELRKVATGP